MFINIFIDISGAAWESMLFDTPVVVPKMSSKWWNGLPSWEDYQKNVISIIPDELIPTMQRVCRSRFEDQKSVAQQRLGIIDGQNIKLIVQQVTTFLGEDGTGVYSFIKGLFAQ